MQVGRAPLLASVSLESVPFSAGPGIQAEQSDVAPDISRTELFLKLTDATAELLSLRRVAHQNQHTLDGVSFFSFQKVFSKRRYGLSSLFQEAGSFTSTIC